MDVLSRHFDEADDLVRFVWPGGKFDAYRKQVKA